MTLEKPDAIRRVLRRGRELVRDLRWTMAGATLRRPQIPLVVRSILFVCKGNICRSPFAAWRARGLAPEHGLDDLQCDSAGFAPSRDGGSPPEAREAARRFGVDLTAHVPSPIASDVATRYDLVVVMEAAHIDAVRRQWPALRERVVLLALFDPVRSPGAYARYNIADPYGQSADAFESCYQRIDRATRGLLGEIARGRALTGP